MPVTLKLLLAALVVAFFDPGIRAANPETKLAPAGVAFFEKKIRPVLLEHCYSCHSADAAKGNKLKAGFALDTAEGLRKGGESGLAIVPGKPERSLLLKTLRHTANTPEMPPKGKLPATVIADFAAWIAMGAPDPRSGVVNTWPRTSSSPPWRPTGTGESHNHHHHGGTGRDPASS